MSTLSDDIAKQFFGSPWNTGLDEYTDTTTEAATILAGREGRLSLTGLTTLSDAAADALAKHGSLNVSGPIQPLIAKFRERA